LFHVVSIESIENSVGFKGDNLFIGKTKSGANTIVDLTSNGFIGASESKVVDLSNHKDFAALIDHLVDIAFVSDGLETNIGDYGGDMFLPKAGCFRMTLKSVEDRNYLGAIETLAKLAFPPFGKGIINADEGRDRRRRGVGKSVLGIATIYDQVLSRREGEKSPEDGLFQTGGVSICLRMKRRGSSKRTVAATARATFAIDFDAILPNKSENLSIRGRRDGLSKHTEVVHLIELFWLICMPKGPWRESLEGTASKARKSTFFIGDSRGLEGMDLVVKSCGVESSGIE
jgi:hypothetical protein